MRKFLLVFTTVVGFCIYGLKRSEEIATAAVERKAQKDAPTPPPPTPEPVRKSNALAAVQTPTPTPIPTPTATPEPPREPKAGDEYYLTTRVSVETDTGVVGIPAQTKVVLVTLGNPMRVTDGKREFSVTADQVTKTLWTVNDFAPPPTTKGFQARQKQQRYNLAKTIPTTPTIPTIRLEKKVSGASGNTTFTFEPNVSYPVFAADARNIMVRHGSGQIAPITYRDASLARARSTPGGTFAANFTLKLSSETSSGSEDGWAFLNAKAINAPKNSFCLYEVFIDDQYATGAVVSCATNGIYGGMVRLDASVPTSRITYKTRYYFEGKELQTTKEW